MSKRLTRPLRRWMLSTGQVLLAAFAIHAGAAVAQSFPTKQIRIVVPFPPAGGNDTVVRLVGPKMAEALKQAVVIENRPGANGHIGAELVARAEPDGYTLLLAASSIAASPALYRQLPFNAATDFARVTQLIGSTLILAVGPKVSAASIGELVALAKSRPGKLNYGHPGVGTNPQLAMELLKQSAGIDILPIPYKGAAAIQVALTSGEVDATFTSISNGVQWAKSGRARVIGVSGARRSAALPEVPTVAEAGIAGFELSSWFGLFVPAKTPRPVIGVLHQAAVEALKAPEVRARLEALGNEVVGNTPEEFDARYKTDLEKFARIIQKLRVSLP